MASRTNVEFWRALSTEFLKTASAKTCAHAILAACEKSGLDGIEFSEMLEQLTGKREAQRSTKKDPPQGVAAGPSQGGHGALGDDLLSHQTAPENGSGGDREE